MKKLYLILLISLIPWVAYAADTPTPTETPTETPTSTPTPTPIISWTAKVSTSVTVGATSTFIIKADVLQYINELILMNDSTETIYINVIGGPAVMNKGIALNANGGSIAWNKSQDLKNFPTANIYAICSSGSKNLLVSAR